MKVHIVSKQPLSEHWQGFVVRQIKVKRGYGDMLAVYSVEVRAGFIIKMWLFTADPKILASTRIGFVDYFPNEGASPLTGNQGSFYLFTGTVGNVDIKERIRRQAIGNYLPGNLYGNLRSISEVVALFKGCQ